MEDRSDWRCRLKEGNRVDGSKALETGSSDYVAHLRFTIWKIPRRWRNLAEQERRGMFETMRVIG